MQTPLSLSCTVTTAAMFDRFKADPSDKMSYFRDISTFGRCAGGHAAALENLAIVEEEKLVENAATVGAHMLNSLEGLKDKHKIIGDVRGMGLLGGMELIKDRTTIEPVDESQVMKIVRRCMRQGLMIGRTNRSLTNLNNTLCLTPALIATKTDIDQIVEMLDIALTEAPL